MRGRVIERTAYSYGSITIGCRSCQVGRLSRRRLRQELGLREETAGAEAARLKLLEENRKVREEQEAVRRRNPILVYVEKLEAADESAWQDNLEGMGNTPDIPKLFRHAGKVPPLSGGLSLCSGPAGWQHISRASSSSVNSPETPAMVLM